MFRIVRLLIGENITMTIGTIIFLNGTSCSGKTSIAKAVQTLLPEPYLHVGLDYFEAMQPVRNGKRIHVFYGQRRLGEDDPTS